MFGVVLWSDKDDQKAVIWCEDHGDLAFFRQSEGDCSVKFDAGDWVQFDVSIQQHMRFAHNPRLVSEGVYADIAGSLETCRPQGPDPDTRLGRLSADIVPLPGACPGQEKPTDKRESERAEA